MSGTCRTVGRGCVDTAANLHPSQMMVVTRQERGGYRPPPPRGSVVIVSQTLDRPTLTSTAVRAVPVVPGVPGSRMVPPAGPAWFGAVMGTGILATLLQLNATALSWAAALAPVVLLVGWGLLVGLSIGYARRVLADPQVLRVGWSDPTTRAQWGMVSMGILAVGSATLTVWPEHVAGDAGPALVADAVLWTVGTLLGLLTAVGFTVMLVRGGTRGIGGVGRPGFVWGLPVVPPMVSATCGAALVPHVGSAATRLVLVAVLVACFVLALGLGTSIFVVVYRHHLFAEPVPVAAATSSWIPLGVVGQSTAAAQAIAGQASPLLHARAGGIHDLADAYGLVMLTLGIPLVGYAAAITVRGVLAGMPFTPGWWSLTFPIGTLALGTHLLGRQPGLVAYQAVGVACCLVLCATWSLCLTASAQAVVRRHVARGPRLRS